MRLDETGLKTDLARLRGWAFGGECLVEAIPGGRWETSTLVQAVTLDGTRAAMVLDRPMNATCLAGFCDWLLTPTLHPGDLVVMPLTRKTGPLEPSIRRGGQSHRSRWVTRDLGAPAGVLIRTIMAQAAVEHGGPSRSVSFKRAVQTLEAFRPLIASFGSRELQGNLRWRRWGGQA